MSADSYMSDEYVASILTKDARESSIKYSAFGLQAFLPKRPTTAAPRPNTRFLKNIIRETDSHNASLKAKEIQDSRSRLSGLQNGGVKFEKPRYSNDRKSKLDDDWEDRRHKKRRIDDKNDHDRRRSSRTEEFSRLDSGSKSKRRGEASRRSHRDYESSSSDDAPNKSKISDRHHRRHRHSKDTNRSRSRSRSPRRSERRDKERHRPRSRSRDRETSHRKSRRRRHRSPSPEIDQKERTSDPQVVDIDSDPLEAIIGPPPPPPEPMVRARGRGTFASSSAMDVHFSTSYDPKVDVVPNSDSENDWDQALEALRDRQRWKQQGAARLREAGFGEDFVQKWEKGGEKTEEDVKWKSKGEGREWDRGKLVGDDGYVDTKPEWGRLKGT